MIRFAEIRDLPRILSVYAPYVRETTYSFEYDVPTEAEFRRRFEDITAQFPWIVWEEDGRVLGYAYGSLPFSRAGYAWCAETSIYLAPEAQGRGIGRALDTVLETLLRRQGYEVLYAIITGENGPSLAFHRAMGFTTVADFPDCGVKFGRRLHVIWMEKRLRTGNVPNAMPVPWMSIVKLDENLTNILDTFPLS